MILRKRFREESRSECPKCRVLSSTQVTICPNCGADREDAREPAAPLRGRRRVSTGSGGN